MNETSSSSRYDVVAAAILAVSVLLAWRVVTLAMADHQFRANPDPWAALAWRGTLPAALTEAAGQALATGDATAATDSARAALAADPLDGAAYRVLAQAALAQNDMPQARRLMALAIAHDPRDVQARNWLAQDALVRHDAAAALEQYDRLLRMAPAAQAGIFPVLTQLATVPEAREPIARMLATDPPWRDAWLRQFAATAADADTVDATFRAVRRASPLTLEESAAFIGHFVEHRQWDRAFAAWAESLTPGQRAALKTPFNGGFELERAPPPFDWDIGSPEGVDAGIRPLPESSGHGLRLEFYGRRTPFNQVRQLLWLQPGQYQLRWRSRLSGLEAARGLRWVIDCADDPANRLASARPDSGTVPWHDYVWPFTVPADCRAQWLRLELEARIPAETLALGTAWYDDVKIDQIGLPNAAQAANIEPLDRRTRRP